MLCRSSCQIIGPTRERNPTLTISVVIVVNVRKNIYMKLSIKSLGRDSAKKSEYRTPFALCFVSWHPAGVQVLELQGLSPCYSTYRGVCIFVQPLASDSPFYETVC